MALILALRVKRADMPTPVVSGGLARTGGDLLLARKDTEYSWDTSFQNRPNGASPMSAIFLSYRRADAEGHAGRLWDRLKHAEALFYDQGRIDSGDVFPECSNSPTAS